MKTARFLLIAFACLLAGCDSTSRLATTSTATVRTLGAEHDHSVTLGEDVVNLNAERAVG